MKNISIWLDGYDENDYTSLKEDITCDILIIGGGITGLQTLYNLRKSNLRIVLVEASLIAHGLSGHTTGKINYLQETIYSDILRKYDYDMAKLYYESQIEAINRIKDVIEKEHIACDFTNTDSFTYTDKEEEIPALKEEMNLLNSFGDNIKEYHHKLKYVNNIYAIRTINTYVFNPVKYLCSLKNIIKKYNKEIYEKTKIVNIKKQDNYYICSTSENTIKCQKLIMACHYPFFLLPYFLPLKTNIEKSYITASLDKNDNKTYITSKNPTTSIRYYNDYLIYLSNSSLISKKLNDKENYANVIKKVNNLNLHPDYIWKNDDLYTVDKIPYIGYLKKNDDSLFIATGYNTWGMTNGILASLILSDLVLNKENKYQNLCNPLRVKTFKYLPEEIKNINNNVLGYLKSKIKKNKSWYQRVTFTKENGQNIAIYHEGKKEYKVYNKCPHLGCSLIFNEVDKTWDCPCHASRFTKDGKCLKGPSNTDITYQNKKISK